MYKYYDQTFDSPQSQHAAAIFCPRWQSTFKLPIAQGEMLHQIPANSHGYGK